MGKWAAAPRARHQLVLISQSVDDLVSGDHPVRLVDGFLGECDWGAWEARYDGHRGQPPIHPRWVASAILYGLMKRIRSSRDLEEATRERVDFKWLLSGRTIDHSTFASFRTRFGEELKGLNRAISRALVLRAGGDAVVELILDGTRVRANSDRNGARSAEALERLIAECSSRLDETLERLGAEDAKDEEMAELRRRVRQMEAERDRYVAALREAGKRDVIKREMDGARATPTRVPVTDRDASILPNKEGGFAPNYTPTAAVESESGAIVSSHVVTGNEEAQAVEQAVEDCRETLATTPDRRVADTSFGTGEALEKMEAEGIESYIPVGPDLRASNPANRPDPTKPIPPEQVSKLPLRNKRFAGGAFVYDAVKDCYYCPMGETLRLARRARYKRTGITYRQYRCPGKEGCPLAERCVQPQAKQRSVSRDQYQHLRERTAERMASAEGQAVYRRRAPVAEGVFAVIKQSMGIRQFLLRGIEKVRTEWNWVRGAYNLKKLLKLLQTEAEMTA